jgi:uncharacterized LabA/DUF88 family protein
MSEPRVAVLIDADNVSGDHASAVLEEAGKQGRVIIRRIYGDWTENAGKKWKKVLADLAIVPVQQFQNTVGKNATDSALIIDCMDLLHHDAAEVFCLISSDADFTRLASRLREAAKTVVGIGQKKTPKAFVNACDRFIFIENLTQASKRNRSGNKAPKQQPVAVAPEAHTLVMRAFDDAENEDGFCYLGTLGSALLKLDPSFDARTYGFRRLSDLVAADPRLKMEKHSTKNAKVVQRV